MNDGKEIFKMPPQAVEVEQAVLGALMLEAEAFDIVSPILNENSFYEHKHMQIFKVIKELSQQRKPIDLMIVTRELRDLNLLDQIGGPLYITELTSKVSSAAHIEFYARIIAEKYAQRDLIRKCIEIQEKAYDPTIDVDQLIVEMQHIGNQLEKHFEIAETGTIQKEVAKDALTEIYNDVEKNRKGEPAGIPTGFSELNKALGGWRPTNLVILAARPGVGKTSLALHFATKAAECGYCVNFFSLEMTQTQLFKIMLSGNSEVNRTRIRDGILTDFELKQIERATGKIENLPIIWNTKQINPHYLKSVIRHNHKSGRCDLVIIDYLQLIEPSDKKALREQQISEISRTLKGIALSEQIPIICLSQLNRMAEKEVPQLHHLRESGAIEQDADVVLFPFRDESQFKIIIGKSRHGKVGTIDVRVNEEMTKFD